MSYYMYTLTVVDRLSAQVKPVLMSILSMYVYHILWYRDPTDTGIPGK